MRGLGLPLKGEVNQLEISRFVVAGQTELLLVEPPNLWISPKRSF
jgi:hypothetical protein